MRMVYKTLGIGIPWPIRQKLLLEGADFSDMFPYVPNNKIGPFHINTMLGMVEFKNPSTDAELR